MFFKSNKSNNHSSESEYLKSMQPQIDKMGLGYEEPMNYLARDLNHFQYKSGRYDMRNNCHYLDFYADESMNEEEAQILEQMIHVMVKDAEIYVQLLSPTTIRLEIYL